MLTLRDDQIRMLRDAKKAKFVVRAIAFTRQSFPKQTSALSDEEIGAMAEDAMKRAVGYGLRSELDYVRFLGMMVSLGADFDSQEKWSWVRDVLEDPELLPEEKMPAVFKRGAVEPRGEDRPDVP